MITINYQKRKNIDLFKYFEDSNTFFLSKTQNYIPIYTRFFTLNDTNYNTINLNNKWYISNINDNLDDSNNLFNCKIKNMETNKVKDRDVFFKMAPLLDPYKYMVGKYDISDAKLFNLPQLNSTINDCNSKFIDVNNSAYVDGFFLFLTSQLRDSHNFLHGVEYYGSFLAIKNNFRINVFDDIDYLNNSEFFNKNKNVIFKIDNYEHLFKQEDKKLKPITIGNNISLKSINSFDNNIFEDVFDDTNNTIDFDDLKDMSLDLVDVTNISLKNEHNVTLKSNSTCSSRTSYTNDDDMDENCDQCGSENNEQSENENFEECSDDQYKTVDEDEDEDDEDENDDDDEEVINVTIPKFPVQVIGMENCENTFDDLILNSNLSSEEWYSSLMQIIMILITYQKAFNFTHNDLHTNNVMYIDTDLEYIEYIYNNVKYNVPTFGKIFKIIDFGRSIYKVNDTLLCSDSYDVKGDANSQYNFEPFFNSKNKRVIPNPSFDLCRLATSMLDFLLECPTKNPNVLSLIEEWCQDDKGKNVLYKNSGEERYPDFKLYKMIARNVNRHTPQNQLTRECFMSFISTSKENTKSTINIDRIPAFFIKPII